MKYFLTTATIITAAIAAYVPSDPWTDLTPSAPAPTGATTDHTHAFGIQIITISAAKRDVVNQIGDGQIQKQTSETLSHPPAPTTTAQVVNQIGDGQIQHQTTAQVVNQIGDGQIQHQTTAQVVNQIGDGQIQHQTTAQVVNQIGDGQIQHQTTAAPPTPTTASVVNQIGDGQIQHQTTAASVVNQIGDGQIQHQTAHNTSTATVASQISDGQIQATGLPADPNAGQSGAGEACLTENSLTMNLKGGILKDSKGRIGAIVANRQFQFDGPPPQAGSIYAAGWSVTKDGKLAIGSTTTFYQCLSGDFYNLYDENVAAQCSAVELGVIDLVKC